MTNFLIQPVDEGVKLVGWNEGTYGKIEMHYNAVVLVIGTLQKTKLLLTNLLS